MSTSESPVHNALHHFDWPADQKVLLAVSGGADSMALLHACIEKGIDVGVAHLDHTTREGASTDDATWLKDQVANLSVPFFQKQVDVPALAEASSQSFEEVARTVRYEFLVDVARKNGYSAIATAHHADDQAETVLMRIVRGTSLTGLAGIPARGEWDGMDVLRPLLTVPRSDLIEYLTENDIPWREDESNTDPSYLRNRIRSTLLPVLRTRFNPSVSAALNRLAELSRIDDRYLGTLADEEYAKCIDITGAVSREYFRALDPALQRRVINRLAQDSGATSEFGRIEAAVEFVSSGGSGLRFDFGNRVQLSNGKDSTLVVPPSHESVNIEPVEIPVPGEVAFDQHAFTTTVTDEAPATNLKAYCNSTRQVFDADRVGNDLLLRMRQPGDRFTPIGMSGSRKLKDYFGDLGLPLEQRDATPIITCRGAILWVVGYAAADPYAVTPSTERFLIVETSHAAE